MSPVRRAVQIDGAGIPQSGEGNGVGWFLDGRKVADYTSLKDRSDQSSEQC